MVYKIAKLCILCIIGLVIIKLINLNFDEKHATVVKKY